MKKVFLLFALLLTSVSLWAQKKVMVYEDPDDAVLLAETDFTTMESFEGWVQFDASQEEEGSKVELTSQGLEITVTSLTGQFWQPQVMVIPDCFDLYYEGNYKIVVTAKFPTEGSLMIDMGTWTENYVNSVWVDASDYFQTVEIPFDLFPNDMEGCHLLFQPGNFQGTTIIKDIKVYDMNGGAIPPKHTYSVIGSINGDWDTDWDMYKDGSNYVTIIDGIAAGYYEFKVRQDHDWAVNWGQDGTHDGPNCVVCVDNDNSRVIIIFNPETGKIDWEVSYRPHDYSLDTVLDWTQYNSYYGDVWYSDNYSTVSVETGVGLIIDSNPPEDGEIYDVQVPMVAHIPEIMEGGEYLVTLTVNAPADGEIRLDFCSWDTEIYYSTTMAVEEGEHTYAVDISNYPGYATNAMIFYQCGQMPGRHIIKDVQVSYLGGGLKYSVAGTIVGEWDVFNDMRKDGSNYVAIFDGVAAGCYEFRVYQDYNPETSWGLEDGSNCEVCIKNENSRITIKFDPETGKIDWEVFSPVYPVITRGTDDLVIDVDYSGLMGDFASWYQFSEYQPDGTVTCIPDGVAITVPTLTGQIWQPQVMVIPDGNFNLYEDGNYKVVVTAKFPTEGTLQVNMGTWSYNYQNTVWVDASDDFQTIEIPFDLCPSDMEGCHLLFQCGDFLGTTIVQKIQVIDLDAEPIQPKPISPAYYLIGNPTGWTTDGARTQKFEHSDADVNEDPYFSIEVETGGDDCYFAIADDAALEAIDTDLDWTKLIGPKSSQEDLNGRLDFRYNIGRDACFHLVGVSKFRMTIDMRDYSYSIEPTYLPVDTLPYQYKEWAGETEYPYSYSNSDGFTATIGEEGVEIYTPETGWYTPFTTILDGASLIQGHTYKVVVTAKVPSDGYMYTYLGNDNWGNQGRSAEISANEDFQQFEFMFNSIDNTFNRNAQVRIESYYYDDPGTMVIQKVEIYDMIPQEAIAYQSKDWTNCSEEDLLWYQFSEGQEGTVEATADGVAITNNEYRDTYWYAQTMVVDSIVLKYNHQYKVRVTAKIPSEGDLYLKVGNWNNFDQYMIRVNPSDEFQVFDFDFWWYTNVGYGDDHILFQNGYLTGTSVVKKIEIFDMSMLTEYDMMALTGKINVADTQVLDFPENTDPNFKPEINITSYDNYNYGSLTLNGYVSAISDLSLWYNFGRASDYGRWYEELQQYDNDRRFFTSFVNNAATSIDDASMTMRLYPYRWEFITLPFDVNMKDVKGVDGVPFVVRKYDGQKRAENLLDETWVDVTEDETLQAGVGYIWQTAYNENEYYNTFTMKATQDANLNRLLGNDNVTVPLAVHEGEFDYNLGWNLIGNPYPSFFDSRAMDFGAPFIVWSNYYDNYEAFSPVDDAYILNPGQAFFVQSTEDQASITFLKEGRQSDLEVRSDVAYGLHSRQTAAAAERTVVNFFVSNGEIGDRTRVVINPEASLAYEADKDASKFMSSEAKIQLYTIEQNVQYAINERPLSKGEVKLGMNCTTRGTYTLTMRTSADCMVKLTDHLTGEEVMLANADTYTFESETGVFDNRFTICFTSGEATGIQNFSSTQDTNDTYYDMQGRRISKPEKGIYIQNGKKVVVK